MKKLTTFISIILIISIYVLVFAGCGGTETGEKKQPEEAAKGEADQEKSDDEVVVRLDTNDEGYPQPFTHHARGPGRSKMRLIFDSLLERGENGHIPWLAKDWEVSEDGTEYTFYIREGIEWQDGEELTAEDVAFSFEYYQDHPPVDISEPVVFDILEDIEVLDDYKVKMTTERAHAPYVLEAGEMRIIPKHIWEDIDDPQQFTDEEAVIGSGPYKLKEYNEEHSTYEFEANPDFWGPKQKVDVLQYRPVSDEVMALENNDIDQAEIPEDVLQRFEDDPTYEIAERPGVWAYRLRINFDNVSWLNEQKARQALAYAIDRENIINTVARGAGIPGNMGLLPPDHHMHNPDVPEYEHDPDKARELMEKADVIDNNEEVSVEIIVGDDQEEVRMAELLRQDLREIGIDLEINSMDSQARDSQSKEGNYELAIMGHGGWGDDPENYFSIRFDDAKEGTGIYGGIPGYENEDVDLIREKQREELDEEKREELIKQVQEIWAEDIPEIPLYYVTGHYVYNKDVYDNWTFVYNHHSIDQHKITYLDRDDEIFEEDK
ncbi:ABC transporter substrate-binding protein [Natranaerofaba carboxydovora]|uniref:ABC transporter substrate-binding protein n=1 Tax=Natranaerofaba carboxydovora TaxID=2742683 RepID=UPI001F12B866|nr:ABC transporter substrate-binding protein [Natranaerofaba carboxydovora]UMZ73441.1 Periplasmic dipeptide transport protein [Natranaerofaba carboxydovora]